MITYDKITRDSYNQLKILYNELHKLFSNPTITKYKYLGNGQFSPYNPPKQSGLFKMLILLKKYLFFTQRVLIIIQH